MQLFGRQGGVRLSEAGERFLPAALDALAAGDRAIAAVTDAGPVVRIDTWGHLYAPMRTVADAVQALGPVRWEPSPGRDWPSVAEALLRGDTDLGFGRVHPSLTAGTRASPSGWYGWNPSTQSSAAARPRRRTSTSARDS
ncbi:hypothetical protein [Streptomyces sp. NBC_00078]|uniref:hypothetical protein n=1 Tax=unclassified Streptomyces TaxID=2593676 RepID=UPI002259566B|nr:hypothetical protein [Streptomyces sp. NBC_00078]MCX5422336.1 hypothetical protein [Streptomyces sp. NBC_00078]